MMYTNLIYKAKKFLFSADYRFIILSGLGLYNRLDDKAYLSRMFRARMGYDINWENPVSFNEKLQWLKVNDRKPIYSSMVDKYEAKEYVANKIGEQYIIPTLGVWNSFEEIDFESLPNQFVLKCTHDSGGLVICRDKRNLNFSTANKRITKSLKRNFFYYGREWPYKNVKPRIIAEQYMEDTTTAELRDYKFFCFNGVAKALFIASDRQKQGEETKFDFFDMDFKHLPFTNGHPNADVLPAKPEKFEEMRVLAEKLSQNIPHLRVDFYEVNGRVYFGELTFSHWSGMVPFKPEEWDKNFGDWIKLPEKWGGYGLIGDGYFLWLHEELSYDELAKINTENEIKNETPNNLPSGLVDYKFYCFNGEPQFLYVSKGLEDHSTARISFLTLDWQFAPYRRSDYAPFEELPPKPTCFEKMVEVCRVLANGFPFLRVDLYEINGHIYFSELTFSPCSGYMPFANRTQDREMGKFLNLHN